MLTRTGIQYDEAVLPEVSRDDVLKALDEFDRTMRGNENWSNWEGKESQKYAIEHDGRLYPPKMILSLASGVPVGNFYGGIQGANKAFEALGFSLVSLTEHRASRDARQIWWVNQGTSYEESREGGFVWAPQKTKNGGNALPHWNRLQELKPNDILVHYADTELRGIGRVKSAAVNAKTPFKKDQWTTDGWRVEVEYFELGARAVPLVRVAALFKDFTLAEGPFTAIGGVKQGYLWRFTPEGLQRIKNEVGDPWPGWANVDSPVVARMDAAFNLGDAVQALTDAIEKRGFVFEPWQVAAFVTALRTKPFVILAGVSGTGKSRLPCLVADAAGCTATVIPVRPDWTDSSDVLGFVDLQGSFRPGPLLEFADRATRDDDTFHLCVIDEMNLARVEHYFAEVLSRIESRNLSPDGKFESDSLLALQLSATDARWGNVRLPSNLAIVGTVNMDESAHGFSRKVLDRAFTLELSDFDLRQWGEMTSSPPMLEWPAAAWSAKPMQLAQRATGNGNDREAILRVINVLVEANDILAQAQLQVGYRTRDEVAFFVLNAGEVAASFITRDGVMVEPLDLALLMKILPRVAGGSAPIRQVMLGLLGFSNKGKALEDDQQAEEIASSWRSSGRPAAVEGARFPRTASRLCLMWDRLITEGFTSFWL